MKSRLDVIVHRDGHITYWSVFRLRWVRRAQFISADDFCAYPLWERERVELKLARDGWRLLRTNTESPVRGFYIASRQWVGPGEMGIYCVLPATRREQSTT